MDVVLVWNGRIADPVPSKGGAIAGTGSATFEATDGVTRPTSGPKAQSRVEPQDEIAQSSDRASN